ncbi:Phage conserved hypothetical protein, C-terminal [uncultured Caudovirales phage]|uniref:Uncharacterized protein n=1 Tax=uncultured Caudovirales phage TaxID=2100421 RepID=A0A6J5MVT4_9CAUD|nr:Phage conserved hypothetical protein, C-terminal [uncultured Caudovirales phage]
MNGYELSRNWFDWAFENPEKINPNHSALYFFAIEHCNRLGWREKFGFPTEMAKDAIGIKSYNTYIKTLNDLVEWDFIKMIQRSKNQYSANIIALSNFDKALDKALDKAIVKHVTKQDESISSIDKQINNKQITNNLSVNWDALLSQFNLITGKKIRVIDDKTKRQVNARLKEGYSKQDIVNAITNCFNDDYHKENPHYLTLEFITRSDKMQKYSQEIIKPKAKQQDRL